MGSNWTFPKQDKATKPALINHKNVVLELYLVSDLRSYAPFAIGTKLADIKVLVFRMGNLLLKQMAASCRTNETDIKCCLVLL